MIIPKSELKTKTSEYIRETIARTEDFVANELIKASADRQYKVRISKPNDIPWWALEEVGMKYQEVGYTVEFALISLLIVLDDEVYEEQKKEDSKRNWGWDI